MATCCSTHSFVLQWRTNLETAPPHQTSSSMALRQYLEKVDPFFIRKKYQALTEPSEDFENQKWATVYFSTSFNAEASEQVQFLVEWTNEWISSDALVPNLYVEVRQAIPRGIKTRFAPLSLLSHSHSGVTCTPSQMVHHLPLAVSSCLCYRQENPSIGTHQVCYPHILRYQCSSSLADGMTTQYLNLANMQCKVVLFTLSCFSSATAVRDLVILFMSVPLSHFLSIMSSSGEHWNQDLVFL